VDDGQFTHLTKLGRKEKGGKKQKKSLLIEKIVK
jgi:hypothetical protein